MNVAFILTPKQDVVWLPAQATLERAIQILAPHRYSAVPIVDADGAYAGTLTEGDILWHLLAAERTGRRIPLGKVRVIDVPRHHSNRAVRIDAEIEALVARAMQQNFVPVIDDREAFIGIVRRQQIIAHCARAWLPR
jgi:CBS domain-containing protein